MRKRLGFAIVVVAAGQAFAAACCAAPIATTESGALVGTFDNGLNVYKGVPYAAAPIGDLRWRPPKPHAPWTGTRKATAFSPACIQQGVSMPGETPPVVSEDCLYLNIWSPTARVQAHLPVIVWIHGGGYRNGSAAMPLYWGDRLAGKGVLVVTVAYRLGPLGFLALPELTRESPLHTSGNYGLMDQIAALEWIHRNIAAFGGDAQRVTIAGQSSGSISISVLMASPRAKGLFQRAIGESGGLFEPLQLAPSYLLANAEHDGEKFAATLHADSLYQLRLLPAADLTGGDNAGGVTHPVIESAVLPRPPRDVFAAAQQNDVPLLLGSNADEARALTDVSHTRADTFDADIAHSFGQLPPAIIAAYPHATDAEAPQARLDLERDLRFGWDMWAWARLQAMTGHERVYYYNFRQQPPFPIGSVYEGWRASHFAELWYVFDHLEQAPWNSTPSDQQLAAAISSYWVNFAKSGNPNGPGLPAWPPFSNGDNHVQYLVEPITTGGVANVESLQVLDAVYTSVRGKPLGEP